MEMSLPEFNQEKATRIAYKYAWDWDTAEDAVQNALIYVWKSWWDYSESQFYKLVKLRAIDEFYRNNKTWIRPFEIIIDEETWEEEMEDFKDEKSLDDISMINVNSILSWIKDERDRSVVFMINVEWRTTRDVSKILWMSKWWVDKSLKRSYELLRKTIIL